MIRSKRFNSKNERIVVGMSGGIDSSIALILLKKQGWKPVGVSLKLPVWKSKDNLSKENICCTHRSLNAAKKVCQQFKVPYFSLNTKTDFRNKVVKYFISEIKKNKTPNPCVICNRYFKIEKLFEFAKEHNIKYVATGHYARTRKNPRTKKYELLTAKDREKDQTYYLSLLTQKWLKYIVFPLGDYTKKEIYRMAKENNLNFLLQKKQSQDFCFIGDAPLKYFLEEEIGENPGFIKDINGRILGKHRGLYFYTIGQRKNIGLSGGPYFVLKKDIKHNILFVTKNKKDLEKKEIVVKNVHWISSEPPDKERLKAKVRYRSPLIDIISLKKILGYSYKITFKRPQRAITPGQFCVFYRGNVCLGGGVID